MIFSGEAALAFSILGGILLASGTGDARALAARAAGRALSLPLRLLGAPGLLASTGLAANRWRTAALATPVVLIAMLVGTQGVLQASSQEDTERVTEARVTADRVVVGPTARRCPPARPARSPACRGSARPPACSRPSCSCSTTASAGTRRGRPPGFRRTPTRRSTSTSRPAAWGTWRPRGRDQQRGRRRGRPARRRRAACPDGRHACRDAARRGRLRPRRRARPRRARPRSSPAVTPPRASTRRSSSRAGRGRSPPTRRPIPASPH